MAADLQLILTLKDKATATLKSVAAAQKRMGEQTAQQNEQMASRSTTAYQRMTQARERLGVRSEHQIRREIKQTELAYQRLARSGLASANTLVRAKQAELNKIKQLNAELRTGSSLYQKMLSGGAAALAGAYVVGREAKKAMSFDERVAFMANTAFPGRDLAGKKRGMQQLESAINTSTLPGIGGGTRDQAAEALNVLVGAGGNIDPNVAMKYLPHTMKVASGNDADPNDIARLIATLVNQGIVKNERDLKVALNMLTAGGQAGGVEIKDLAKGLPAQLGVGKAAGLTGLSGLRTLVGLNEVALLTAGNADESMNNVKNYLTKIISPDTAKDFEKAGRGDLSSFLLNQRYKGVDAVNAWNNLIDQEISQSPQGKQLLAKLKNSQNKAETQETIDAINQLIEGNIIGTYFQDMQARSALLATRNKAFMAEVDNVIAQNMTPVGVNDSNYQLLQTTASTQVRAAQQAKEASTKSVLDGLTPVIGKVADGFSDLAIKHPKLAGAAVLATSAITAMGVAAGLASVGFGGKAGGLMSKAGLSGLLKNGRGLLVRGGAALLSPAAAGVTLAGGVGYGLGTLANKELDKSINYLSDGQNGSLGGLIYDLVNAPASKQPAKVETTVKVQLGDGLKAISQTTTTGGPVKNFMSTGSITGIP